MYNVQIRPLDHFFIPDGVWYNLWLNDNAAVKLRQYLAKIGNRYRSKGFMVETIDFLGAGSSAGGVTQNPVEGKLDWPIMGFLLGGHGIPPLKIFTDNAPRGGGIVLHDDLDALMPADLESMNKQGVSV